MGFQRSLEESVEMLDRLFNRIWEEERAPLEWLKGNIVKIPKKGDLADCNNWREVNLLIVAFKIFARVLFARAA